MSEVKREPIRTRDADGEELITFDVNHSHADIIRYVFSDIGQDIFSLCSTVVKEEA